MKAHSALAILINLFNVCVFKPSAYAFFVAYYGAGDEAFVWNALHLSFLNHLHPNGLVGARTHPNRYLLGLSKRIARDDADSSQADYQGAQPDVHLCNLTSSVIILLCLNS